MGIKATIMIDDDRWAKHPYGVKFDDEECNCESFTPMVLTVGINAIGSSKERKLQDMI